MFVLRVTLNSFVASRRRTKRRATATEVYGFNYPQFPQEKPPVTETVPEGIHTDCKEDPVIKWRFGQLIRAGATPAHAEAIARRRDIDLHVATNIVSKAGDDLAIQILY